MNYYDNYGKFDGLKQVAEIELHEEPYMFNIIGIWIDGDGGYYLATDSGCSCPIPWENLTRADLTGPLTREQAEQETKDLAKHNSWSEDVAKAAVKAFWKGYV